MMTPGKQLDSVSQMFGRFNPNLAGTAFGQDYAMLSGGGSEGGFGLPGAEAAGKRLPLNIMTGASGTPVPEIDHAREMLDGARGGIMQPPGAGGFGVGQTPFGGQVKTGFSVGDDDNPQQRAISPRGAV